MSEISKEFFENIEALGLTRSQLEKLMVDCLKSSELFGATFFPERFYRPFSKLHHQIIEKIDHSPSKKIAIAAPRGIGKTSLCNLLLPAKRILYQQKKYIVCVSATNTSAVEQTENLKRELERNPLIQGLFGDLKSPKSWAKDSWTTSTGIHIFPRGAGQQIRGLLYNNSRPDLILVDDLEDPEKVDSQEQRQKKKEWFFADLCNCIDRGRKDWQIVVLGTVLHEDSLLVNLLEDPTWDVIRLEICDDDFKSNAPEMITDAEVLDLYNSLKSQGLADVFFREYRNIPVSKENATFREEYFQYYDIPESDFLTNRNYESFVLVDPAKTVQIHSCDSAIIGVTINTKENKIYFRDLVLAKLHPDEILQEAFAMCERLRAKVLGVEVTSLNEFITYPIMNEIIRRRLHLNFVELKARGKKEDRVASLVPFYRQGLIYHHKSLMGPLEAQLLMFPRSRGWDAMDAAAYTVEMLETGERYFLGEDSSNIEEEYEELLQEDAREGDLSYNFAP